MKRFVGLVALCAGVALAGEYPIEMPKMGSVRATGGFWAAREATNRLVTARANLQQSESSGRIANFENAGKKIRGQAHDKFRGTFFNDSDVYKVAEGMAYELALHPDAQDAAALEALVEKFIWAQEPDGYVYTARTLGDRHERVGDHRWYCDDAHELYCMGHLIEAAVAHHETTGRDNLLKAVCRTADMMRATFGTGADQIRFLPGHPEVELALCKLFRATGKRVYLDLALDLLDMRGLPKEARVGEVKRGFPDNRPYYQDHQPVREQREAVGHAVRACYLYAGMCEAGVLADDKGLLEAVDALWEDIVTKKLYLSGGVGARPEIEGFGPAYDLPNDHVCLETCAAIAHALFNQRMFQRFGDAKYLDLIERIAYNGSLCSISIAGDEFFYPNPMASRGGYKRSKWFGCACCPPNVVRFIPQLINWTFASRPAKNTYYWNFFLTGEADLGRVKFVQTTDYPWEGRMKLVVNPAKNGDVFDLKVRVPGWARGVPAPGGLYTQTDPARAADVQLSVNGLAVNALVEKDGFLTVAGRAWQAGDVVELELPMSVKRIRADERIELDRNRLAVERGPLVYCAEGVDNQGKAFNAVLPADATFQTEPIEIAATKMVAVKGGGLTLVPFFAWCHRGAGEMQTWFPVSREAASGNAQGIITKASHGWHLDTLDALFDGKLPKSSADESIPRFSFWPHLGKEDWVEFELPMRRPVKGIEIYWFDDHHVGRGRCGLPAGWKVQSRLFPGLPWTDVKDAVYTTVRDGFSTATFPAPIESETFRVCVQARPGLSAGMLEMRVKGGESVPAVTGVAFENPVFREDAPDPTVWTLADGTFRCSSTTKEILKSTDLVHWEKTGRKLLLDEEMKWINRHWAHIWAPNVVKIGDRYLVYMTYHTTGEHTAIAVYSSKDGEGPFTDGKIILTSEGHGRFETIDANAVVDPDTGKVWLFFGHGDIRRVELRPDGRGIAPGAQIEHVAGVELGRPGFPVEDARFPNNFTEGAYVYRHGGWWYLFVSEGFYTDHTYRVGVGRAKTLDGEFVDKEGRKMKDAYSSVILRSDKGEEFFGPGHNGEIVVSPSGKTYMFYHCHWTGLMPDTEGSRPKYIPRPLCLQEIKWGEDGWPYFDNSKPAKTGTWE